MNARELAAYEILEGSFNDMSSALTDACRLLAEDPPSIPRPQLPLWTDGFKVTVDESQAKPTNFEIDLADETPHVAKDFYVIPIKEFYEILSRAVNTLEPHRMPDWALKIHDKLWQLDGDVTLTF